MALVALVQAKRPSRNEIFQRLPNGPNDDDDILFKHGNVVCTSDILGSIALSECIIYF